MKIYTHRAPPDGGSSRAADNGAGDPFPLAPGVSWVRFGEETLLFSDEPAAGESLGAGPPPSRGARVPRREEEVTKGELHIVVQNGRLFQEHNPDVAVLHDRGRFLLVKLDPERARSLAAEHQTCYGVLPVEADQVVFERAPAVAARAPVPFVQELVNKVRRDSLETDLKKLVSYRTRNSTSVEFNEAAMWVKSQLDLLGYHTRGQTVSVGGGTSCNVIADRQGKGDDSTRGVVIVTAHLDSINLSGGENAPAPGADDNGSGSAGVLQIARALRSNRNMHDLRLILFGGEEQGLFGSRKYVSSLTTKERRRIRSVVNMDMIGSLSGGTPSVLIEGASVSQSVIDGLSQAAATYTQLTVETSLNPFASDHVPFIDAQIPAVLTIEGADNTNDSIHSANDVIEKIDYDFALEILRMNLAFVAGEIGSLP